jgi:uncharacterized iron-regulated membrane protein
MKTFRKILFWCHLAAGVTAGVVILLMSVTGVLLTYEKQIIAWADTRNYQVAPPTPGGKKLPVEQLAAIFQETTGAAPLSLTVRSGESEPYGFGVASPERRGELVLFVDPYTGAVLGGQSTGVRNFFRTVTEIHRWIGMQGESRATGKAITGAANLLFLFIVLSGLYLWFPRRWKWVQFRNALWFRRKLSSKARDFNWHHVFGFWLFLPLAIVVASAVVISYPWANNLVFRIMGEEPAQMRRPGPPSGEVAVIANLEGMENLLEVARSQVDGWRTITVRFPTEGEEAVAFAIDAGNGGQPQKRSTITLDRNTAEVIGRETFDQNTPGRKLRLFLRFAHTGEIAGFIGQTIAGIASFGAMLLAYTGIALTWRRFRSWLKRRKGPVAHSTREEEVLV